MSATTLPETPASFAAQAAPVAAAAQPSCDECLGSGGWFRYEPALEPSPGLLYLSCVQCQGSGRISLARG